MNPQHKGQRNVVGGPSPERGLQGRRTEDPLKRIGMFVVLAIGLGSILIAACNGGDTPTQTERPDVTPAATLPQPTDTPPATVEIPSPDPTPTTQATATRSPGPTATTEAPADSEKAASIAAVQSPGMGTVLADSDGNTLYLFTNDESNVSNCSGGCAGAWPPLLTVGDPQPEEGVNADSLATIERDDGSMQVTYNGWPLYYFANDRQPGDTNGQGVGNVWWVVSTHGGPIQTDALVTLSDHADLGSILTVHQ